jgi:hypothetical protein
MKSKKMAFTSLIAVFLLGFALGFAGNRLFSSYQKRHSLPHRDKGHTSKLMAQLSSELDLSEDQKVQLKALLDELKGKVDTIRKDTRPHYKRVNEEFKADFLKILSAEQKEKFMHIDERFDKKDRHKERR